MIQVHDDVLTDPLAYRAAAVAQPVQSMTFGATTFHGLALAPDPTFLTWFAATYPAYAPTLTFLRTSPAGQIEPNDIHTDVDMGDVTALLYLTLDPPPGDGTTFWQHRASGATDGDAWLHAIPPWVQLTVTAIELEVDAAVDTFAAQLTSKVAGCVGV